MISLSAIPCEHADAACHRTVPAVDRPDGHLDRPPADARADWRARIGDRSTGRGRSLCSIIPTSCPRLRSPASCRRRWIPRSRPSPCRATGRCRTPATTRTTPMCRCRSAGRRRRLPERDTTGVYRTTFAVPRGVEGHADRAARRRRRERARGVRQRRRSSATAPTAGCRASTTSRDMCVTGKTNDLAIVVIRYSAGSYIEDQDQWWMAGLHRSVHIESRPLVHIGDVRCDGDYDPATGEGSVKVVTEVAFGTQAGTGMDRAHHACAHRRVASSASLRHRRCRTCSPRRYVFTGHTVEATVDGAVVRGVVGRGTQPLRGHVRVAQSRRDPRRDVDTSHRSAPCRGRRPPTARQRPADLDLRCQPPRSPPRSRQGRQRRRHPSRPAGDAQPQHHRRAHLPLPERPACSTTCATSWGCTSSTRPTSRATPTTPASATTRDTEPAFLERARAHGAARPQPSVDHPVEPRQRERLRLESRRPRRVDPSRRPQPPAALRGRDHARRRQPAAAFDGQLGQRRSAGHRHHLPDVSADREHPPIRRRWRRSTVR